MKNSDSYKMGEQLFLDIWNKWGAPREITDNKDINNFLNEIIEVSDGLVILDHFSHINFDYIKYIKYQNPYTLLYWKDHDVLRQKYITNTISADELYDWQFDGFVTYSYMLLHINKLKFVQKGSHLFILILLHVIPNKKIKRFLIGPQDELILEDDNKANLYKEFDFYEGKKQDLKKHFCFVNNLPYYTCLIQPKENNVDTLYSRKILLFETIQEIENRMNKVHRSLTQISEYEYDDLYSQGNTIRRILEYSLKFFCLFKNIEIRLDDKYGHIKLGDLKKEINNGYYGVIIKQSLVNIANELSHDSGVVFTKDELLKFWKDVMELLKDLVVEIFKN